MLQSEQTFTWTKSREKAAQLVADDGLADEAIAEQCNISRMTLSRWKKHPEFAARVTAHQEEFKRRVRQHGIAVAERRVAALQDRWERMQRIIQERGASEEMQDVDGGQTGLLVHRVKGIGKGENFRVVDEYEVDTGLLAEMRAHEKQAAQELGQWTEKQEQSGKLQLEHIGGALFDKLSDDELDQRLAQAQRGEATPGIPPKP